MSKRKMGVRERLEEAHRTACELVDSLPIKTDRWVKASKLEEQLRQTIRQMKGVK